MTRIQQLVAGTVVAVLAIVAAGWFVVIAPQKHKASSLVSQATQQDQSNDGMRTQLNVLKADLQAVPSEQALVAAINQKIPNNPALPSYVRALTTAAQKAGIELVATAPAAPIAIQAPVAAAVPVASPAPSTGAAAAPAAAAPAASAAGLQQLSVTLTAQGGYWQLQQFVAALEKLDRTTVVSTVALSPIAPLKKVTEPSAAPTPPAWKSLQAAITVSVFINSSTTFAIAAAPTAAAGPVATGAAAPSGSPTPSPSASTSN